MFPRALSFLEILGPRFLEDNSLWILTGGKPVTGYPESQMNQTVFLCFIFSLLVFANRPILAMCPGGVDMRCYEIKIVGNMALDKVLYGDAEEKVPILNLLSFSICLNLSQVRKRLSVRRVVRCSRRIGETFMSLAFGSKTLLWMYPHFNISVRDSPLIRIMCIAMPPSASRQHPRSDS